MEHAGLKPFLTAARGALSRAPVLMVFAEDRVEIASTLRHHLGAGFTTCLLFAPPGLPLPADLPPGVHVVREDCRLPGAVPAAVNAVIAAAPPGTWLAWCYNAEYLFHPFRESRSLTEMLAFHAEERRDAMLTCIVDLYAPDPARHPGGVSVEAAHLDAAGYFFLPRCDPADPSLALERQIDIFGGLRRRYEEHVPPDRRRIDRIGLFRARRGLTLRADLTFDVAEYNTVACPWHHNLTAAFCSFRAAKALRTNPGSRAAVGSFAWPQAVPFDWTSRQLLDLGLIEPGQWF